MTFIQENRCAEKLFQLEVFLIETSLERRKIHRIYQQVFENLEICRHDATTVVSTILQESFSHENEKLR